MKRMYSEQEVQAITNNVITSTVPSIVVEVLAGMGITYDSEAEVVSIAKLKIEAQLRDSLNSTGLDGQVLQASDSKPVWTTPE